MLDRGETLPTLPPWFAQENKWRSARYGMDAIIITNAAGDEELVTDAVGRWLVELAPVAERLGVRGRARAGAGDPAPRRVVPAAAGRRPPARGRARRGGPLARRRAQGRTSALGPRPCRRESG